MKEPIGNWLNGESSYPHGHSVEEITFLNCTDISNASVQHHLAHFLSGNMKHPLTKWLEQTAEKKKNAAQSFLSSTVLYWLALYLE